ncbi:cytochrome d ubiquinol oxidase subunit II [Paenibacillus sp. KQZ6P-2]|uniref:Cytochrome d ubiquinol oxidase subunit II n=1 Tax=Paenibacillus mangrovi TaxID=2931978 RepID=A0A9X2B5M4_9BACL|nr:cytochrome d ubiquinol oxidase subunit II [Paenibacillus mangrovi]MCJ8012872.1 cytochrome d ubiquinol oxidase subunit II [Paenibacillus mangrovi]
MLSLNELWFLLIAVLFTGFFFLEGFDFGIGMSTGILAKTDNERRLLINSIGPFWDGNEVWLLTAGGAMFAAFPNWYATLFSGFYTPLVLLLLALIGRGVAFEYRGKVQKESWKKTWDILIFTGSLLPPLLLGVVFSDLIQGLPIDQAMEMKASFFGDIVNVYSVVGGLTMVMLCLVHGLLFATLRVSGDLHDRARKMARNLMVPLAVLVVAFLTLTYFNTNVFEVRGGILAAVIVVMIAALALAAMFSGKKRDGWAFGMTGVVIAATIAFFFIGLFPNVMISSIDTAFNLTITNAASGHYSLKVMTIVALSLLPFVLGYQIWSYFVFHKRVNEKHLEY